MSDAIAGREGRFPGGPDLASALASSLRTPAAAWCIGVGVAALVGATAAAAISAHIQNGSTASAALRPSIFDSTSSASATPPTVAGFDVGRAWSEERALLLATAGLRVRPADSWAPAGGLSTLLATRFPSAGATRTGEAEVAGVPLPLPRNGGVARETIARVKPVQIAPQVASLPPQPKSGDLGLFDKLFGDPDRAAKAVLAANPNTALYDINKRAVYLPDGDRLEAHSGFGKWMDDPESVARKDVGVTPPNVYAVAFREKPFHGVRALRMKPVGGGNMYGRDGILAHSFLLGEAGASNGCISVRDYDKFLRAYEDGKFDQIIVLRSADEPGPSQVASNQAGGT
jgi:hypothetical protein